MTVADYIAQFLVSRGVRHIFGFQGSAMLKMLDAIMATGKIEYVQNFHEQASAFAADAYARISGGIGVAIATSGPGASNLITGIANAYFDSVPTLFLTGQDRLSNVNRNNGARQNGFQDMDIVGIVRSIAKFAVRVDSAKQIPTILEYATNAAVSGRCGPVLVDVPYDVQFADVNDLSLHRNEFEAEVPLVLASRIDDVLKMIGRAVRPVILVGGGVRSAGAVQELKDFVEETGMPVVSTLMGLDGCCASVGLAGLYGNADSNRLLRQADLILALGVRFAAQHVGKSMSEYAPLARVVHVDIDPTELGRTFVDRSGLTIQCDVRAFLQTLRKRGIPRKVPVLGCYEAGARQPPVHLLQRLFAQLPPSAVIVADVGSNQMWSAQAYRADSGVRFITSAGNGAMGYALPAALGASFCSNGPVVCVTGDGGLQMNLQELNTLSLHQLNVKVVVMNNGSLGLMRAMQKKHFAGRMCGNSSADFSCPDLVKLSEAYGLPCHRVSRLDDVLAFGNIVSGTGPCLIDVGVDPDIHPLTRDVG